MASQNINVGTAANQGDGESLRSAFIDIRKMFAEVYGQTYTADTQDLSGTTLAIKESQLSVTNSAVDNYILSYDNASGGFTWVQQFDGDITSVVAGDGMTGGATTDDATLNVVGGDGITVSADEVEATVDDSTIELSASNGSGALRVKDLGIATGKIANDAVTADKLANSINTLIAANTAKTGISSGQASAITANTAKETNATHSGDVSGDTVLTIGDDKVITAKILDANVTTAKIANDNVTHDKLEGRYTALQTITTTSGTIDLAAQTYAAFNLTGNLGTATLNIQNMKKGQVIDILLSGTLSGAAITLADDFTTSTINKVGSTALDTSKTNLIQVLCIDDNDSAAILTYAVADYAVNTTV